MLKNGVGEADLISTPVSLTRRCSACSGQYIDHTVHRERAWGMGGAVCASTLGKDTVSRTVLEEIRSKGRKHQRLYYMTLLA